MKHFTCKVLTAALIAFAGCTGAVRAQKPLENSLLWEISGNGLQKPSYLYGTIHLICENDFYMSDKTKKAFEKSAGLVMETNVFDPSEIAVAQKMMIADTPISKKMPPAQFAELDSLVKMGTGVSLMQINNFRLSVVASLLAMKSIPCSTAKSYEAEFNQMAISTKKTVGVLEKMSEQMEYFNKAFTDDVIIQQIREFNKQKEMMAELVKLYRAEQMEELYKLLTEGQSLNDQSLDWLLHNRNANWAERMPDMMKKESSFFAVGAAHLAGEKGVIRLLRQKGYKVTAVMN
ncbi:MAG: TraB/GumN family protein [Chitinophagaceae bacterium]|nr:TraB/GumN family protein [Chitinophagaceae bacterium]